MDYISQRQANLAGRYPLTDIAGEVSRWVGILGSLVTALAGYGILTAAQGDAVTGLLGLIPGVVTGITTAIAAFRVAGRGAQVVTPVADPRNDSGQQLVPAS